MKFQTFAPFLSPLGPPIQLAFRAPLRSLYIRLATEGPFRLSGGPITPTGLGTGGGGTRQASLVWTDSWARR